MKLFCGVIIVDDAIDFKVSRYIYILYYKINSNVYILRILMNEVLCLFSLLFFI